MPPTSQQADFPSPAIAREGWPIVAMFIVGAAVLTAGAWFIHPVAGWIIGGLTGALCLWCIWFFRDPPRRIPGDPTAVISPADGYVCFVGPARPPAELGIEPAIADRMIRVSVFMNVFNVHVNRSPIEATVTAIHYHPGKFFNASLDKACEHNERCGLALRTPGGHVIACVQIAGLVARRIICRVGVGTDLSAGERFGLIRFGSRVDTYLPPGCEPLVRVRQKSVAGETILARFGPPEAR